MIDASVWVAARFPAEPAHAESARLVTGVLGSATAVVLPHLARVECVAAVARKTGDSALALETGERMDAIPRVRWAALDARQAEDAARIAARCRLRAADAVYVAAARRARATLVTLDAEVRERAAGEVPCAGPEDWLRGR